MTEGSKSDPRRDAARNECAEELVQNTEDVPRQSPEAGFQARHNGQIMRMITAEEDKKSPSAGRAGHIHSSGNLKDKLRPELDVAVVGNNGIDVAEGTRPRSERGNRRLRLCQLRMVKHVEELGA